MHSVGNRCQRTARKENQNLSILIWGCLAWWQPVYFAEQTQLRRLLLLFQAVLQSSGNKYNFLKYFVPRGDFSDLLRSDAQTSPVEQEQFWAVISFIPLEEITLNFSVKVSLLSYTWQVAANTQSCPGSAVPAPCRKHPRQTELSVRSLR